MPRFLTLILLTSSLFTAGCLSVRLPKAVIQQYGENVTLSWKEIVKQTLTHHPDLQQAHYLVKSAARSRDSAAGDYLPSVEGSLERSRTKSTTPGEPEDGLDLDATATQPLFAGFGITGEFLRAQKELKAEEFSYWQTSAEIRFRLRSVYIGLLRLEDLLQVSTQIAKRRNQNAEMIKLRYEAGREHMGSLLRAQAIASQAEFEVGQTQRQIESQSLRLGRESGGLFQMPVHLEDHLEKLVVKIPAPNPDLAVLAEQTPQVKQQMQLAESFKAGILSAQSAVWPQVDGTYNYGSSGEDESQLRDRSFLGLRVTVPFFSGGKNVAAIRKAKADYEYAVARARSVRDEVLVQHSEAYASFLDAIEQVNVRRKFLEASKERSDIIRSQYTTGLSNFQEFDIAEQDYADSQKNYVQALANALIQQANWELVQGEPLENIAL